MKKTKLFNQHQILNATFSTFGGYEMPLWYSSAKDEHLNVLNNIGIFDTSHMSILTLEGDDAKGLINSSFSRNVSKLINGKSIYGLFLLKDNKVLDDALIYKISHDFYMIVVNAGMSEKLIDHLKSFNFNNLSYTNYTEKIGKIDVQGPKSLKLLEKLYGKEYFDTFTYFSFKGDLNSTLISRSGYTGEFGFELFTPIEKLEDLWIRLLETGKEFNLLPCGLAARDSLRVGAGLPLSHQDIGDWSFGNTPWDFAVDSSKRIIPKTFIYSFVGFDVRKLSEHSGDVLFNSSVVGRVLTCVSEMSLTRVNNKIECISSNTLDKSIKIKGLSAGFILVNCELQFGDIVEIRDSKRNLKVEIVKDIRPNRTARKPIENMRRSYE